MYLTDLADAARKSGLKVTGVPGWRTRGVGPMLGVKTVTCHHTAGARTGNAPSLNVVTHGRAGLAGPLCNLHLARDGLVTVVAAGYANHAGQSLATAYTNRWAIGIEAEATGVDAWPAAQYDAYVRLCRALIDHYRLPVTAVMGHKETCSPRGRKIDPNFDMTAFRRRVAAVTATTPKPAPKKDVLDMDEKQLRAIISDEMTKALRSYKQTDPTKGVVSAGRASQLTGYILRGGDDRPNLTQITDALARIETEVTK